MCVCGGYIYICVIALNFVQVSLSKGFRRCKVNYLAIPPQLC